MTEISQRIKYIVAFFDAMITQLEMKQKLDRPEVPLFTGVLQAPLIRESKDLEIQYCVNHARLIMWHHMALSGIAIFSNHNIS